MKKYIVVKSFRDAKNFAVKYQVGDEILEGKEFPEARIQNLIKSNLVEEVEVEEETVKPESKPEPEQKVAKKGKKEATAQKEPETQKPEVTEQNPAESDNDTDKVILTDEEKEALKKELGE